MLITKLCCFTLLIQAVWSEDEVPKPVLTGSPKGPDYCNVPELYPCGLPDYNNQHIFCKCDEYKCHNYKIKNMTSFRLYTLQLHNHYRSLVAMQQETEKTAYGELMPPASDMNALSWSYALEDAARCNAKKCIDPLQHDFCHLTPVYPKMAGGGQNLFRTTDTSCMWPSGPIKGCAEFTNEKWEILVYSAMRNCTSPGESPAPPFHHRSVTSCQGSAVDGNRLSTIPSRGASSGSRPTCSASFYASGAQCAHRGHILEVFRFQNPAQVKWYPPISTLTGFHSNRYEEFKDVTNESIFHSYYVDPDRRKYGHMTTLLWAKTTEVGCAIAADKEEMNYFFTCNYYPTGNIYQRKVFTVGPAATGCTKERPAYCRVQGLQGLCGNGVLPPEPAEDFFISSPLEGVISARGRRRYGRNSSVPKKPPVGIVLLFLTGICVLNALFL